MQVEVLPLQGLLLLTPRVFADERGFFMESWNQNSWNSLACPDQQVDFVQDNHSRSSKGVLRGLHYQLPPHPQGKLVRCVAGEIFDVAVDLRRSSPTFAQWYGVHLSSENHRQLWLPPGFAHGFVTLSDQADVLYKTTDFWNANCERSLAWDDPQIGILWPAPAGAEPASLSAPVLSSKDALAPKLADMTAEHLFA